MNPQLTESLLPPVESSLMRMRSAQEQILQVSKLVQSEEVLGDVRSEFIQNLKAGHRYAEDEELEELWNLVSRLFNRLSSQGGENKESGGPTESELEEIGKHGALGLAALLQMDEMAPHSFYRPHLLLNSLFTSAVSDYESCISDCLTTLVRHKPTGVWGRTATVPARQLFSSGGDLESLQETVIRTWVVDEMRVGYKKWKEVFTKLQVNDALDPSEIEEVFERRHCIIHNKAKAGDEYCKQNGAPPLNTTLDVDPVYLSSSLDILMTSALKLLGRIATYANRGPDAETGELRAVDWSVKMMKYRRYNVALEFLNSLPSERFSSPKAPELLKVNIWLLHQIMGTFNDEMLKEVKEWETGHLDNQYKMARLCLLGKDKEAYALSIRLLSERSRFLFEWASWPILHNVREYAKNNGLPPFAKDGIGGRIKFASEAPPADPTESAAPHGEAPPADPTDSAAPHDEAPPADPTDSAAGRDSSPSV